MSEELTLEERIEQMKAETVEVCALEGETSSACSVRLEILEEMRAARYHRNLEASRRLLRAFCQDHSCEV
jgi:biotin synthase-like enzyme